jgi:cytochrome c biogenesis protein CcmG/thiol:disulfide interchange protein DsbE
VSRLRTLALVAVLALAGVALYVGSGDDAPGDGTSSSPSPDPLVGLRAQAALGPCPTSIGPELPDLTLACLGGGPAVRLRGPGSGVPTVVNFYGSWCGPCLKEMPLLVEFSRRAAGKVALVGIDTQDPERDGLLFAKDVGQDWPALVDAEGDARRRYATGAPASLFVDAVGRVAFVKVGAFRDLPELVALTRQHLQVAV